MMLRRRAMYSGLELPTGYQRCTFLKKSDTAYIDTGIIPDKSMDYDVVFDVESTYQGSLYVFGSDSSYQNGFNLGCDFTNEFGIRTCKFSKSGYYSTYIKLNSRVQYSIKMWKNQFVVNSKVFLVDSGPYVCAHSLILFGTNRAGKAMVNGTYCRNLRIYSFTISKDGNKIMNLIPALDRNSTPCMYDTISKQTFYNKGTGEFLYELLRHKADELPAGYKRCKWLSSKNDAYLITDYYPKSGDAIEIYFSIDRQRNFDVPINAGYGSGTDRMILIVFSSNACVYFKYLTEGDATKFYLKQYTGGEPRKLVIDKDGRLIAYNGNLLTDKEVKKNKKEINAPLFLFERSNHAAHFSGKIGTVTFTRGGKKSLNLIPCLNEHNVPCMYDTVSGKSYYNKGKGTFGYELL